MFSKAKSRFALPVLAVATCFFAASSAAPASAKKGGATSKQQMNAPALRKHVNADLDPMIAAQVEAPVGVGGPLTFELPEVETTRHPDDAETTSREEMTTSPPPEAPKSATSVLLTIGESIEQQLHDHHGQGMNAAIAFIFGLVMVVDGQFVFKWLVVGGVFILASILTYNEMAALWGFENKAMVRLIVLEVGVCSAFAALRGIEGMMITVGAILGALVAREAQKSLITVGWTSFETNKWCVVILYSLFVLSFMALIALKKHKKVLAVLSSAVGGALVASAASWLLTVMALSGYMDTVLSVFKQGVKPAGGAWVDFLELLWTPTSKDKGVFAGSPYNFTIFGNVYRLDRICGCTLWTILFLGGVFIQLKALAKSDKPGKVRSAVSKGSARAPLQEPLVTSKS